MRNEKFKIKINTLVKSENDLFDEFKERKDYKLVRCLDVILSLLLLLLTFPILLISIIVIIFLYGFPIIYHQERRGYLGKKIIIYKLITMKKVTNELGNYQITKFGSLLRKLRINEIPQIINVLKGEMSLVGPRPDIESTYQFCIHNIKYYRLRLCVIPGITGNAQVNYKYVDSLNVKNFTERLEYDLYFIKNKSLKIYLLILFKTIRQVVAMRGK